MKQDNQGLALAKKERRQLADLYDALVGIVSEWGSDCFDQFHKRGGTAMLNELETILQRVAPSELASLPQ